MAISLPQGGGKTSLCDCLETVLNECMGIRTAVISYDDLYLTREDQVATTKIYGHNKYLAGRGVAGTHDIQFGRQVLNNLIFESKEGSTTKIPQYDKSAFDGKGDRSPESSWKQVEGKIDLVILEGWMLGYQKVPASDAALAKYGDQMSEINDMMPIYAEEWHPFFDASILIGVQDPEVVYDWREEAENTQRRSKGQGAMSKEEIRHFCSRFMPSYEIYLPGLMEKGLL